MADTSSHSKQTSTSTTANLKNLAELINDTDTRYLDQDSYLWGCTGCLVLWQDTPICWSCEFPGMVIAAPLSRGDLRVVRSSATKMFTAYHYIPDEEFAHYFTERWKNLNERSS
jgi:hypothetical protein